MDLVAVLKAEGLQVEDHRVPSAPGAFSPIGVVFHHTASRPPAAAPSLNVVRFGNAGTARGPLCNVLVGRDLIVRVITDGRANDSGMGSSLVLERVRLGFPPLGDARDVARLSNVNGNPFFYDIEIENDGTGEPWADELVDTSCRVAAAILRVKGYTSDRAILHREWTARKIDPNWDDGPTWRSITDTFLNPLVVASVPNEEEPMRFVKRPSPDDRVYLTNGAWKERMLAGTWEQKAADLGIPKVAEVIDAGAVNRMLTLGDDPA